MIRYRALVTALTPLSFAAQDALESDFFEGDHEWSNHRTVPFLKAYIGK